LVLGQNRLFNTAAVGGGFIIFQRRNGMGTTERDNYVRLCLTGIKIVSFEEEDHCVSSGQPYDGVSVSSDDTIEIKAGRHGTSEVAAWFKNQSSGGVVIGCDTDDQYPSKLNFAVFGTLTFEFNGKTHVVKKMLLAQGHNARDRNNWWTGGPQMQGGTMNPWIGAAIATAYNKNGNIPFAKVAFMADVSDTSKFNLGVIGL